LRVLVVGPGAVGVALYYALSRKVDVWLGVLERHRSLERDGVEVVLPSGRKVIARPRIIVVEPEAPRIPYFDVVILAVKAYSLPRALTQIAPLVGLDTSVVTIQNGWDPHGKAIEHFGYRAVHALLTLGASKRRGTITVVSWGAAIVGSRFGITRYVCRAAEVFSLAGMNVRVVKDIDAWTWLKLAVNAAINPITAILGVENGVVANPELSTIAELVIDEVSLVASRCLGVELPEDPWQLFSRVLRETARNRSSMLQDIELGRRTEIEFINGAVCRIAKECGLDAKANFVLSMLVKYLERRSRG